MSNEYAKAFSELESRASAGITVIAHGGVNGQPKTVCYTVNEWYQADEVACEEEWGGVLSDEGLNIDVSVEDILNNGIDTYEHHLEEKLLSSFPEEDGEHRVSKLADFYKEFDAFENKGDFLDFLEQDHIKNELEVLRALVFWGLA